MINNFLTYSAQQETWNCFDRIDWLDAKWDIGYRASLLLTS